VAAVFAAFEVATQRGRAARLDGRHHLELIETDMTGMRRSPRRAVTGTKIDAIRKSLPSARAEPSAAAVANDAPRAMVTRRLSRWAEATMTGLPRCETR
jgi:hypothetical protein